MKRSATLITLALTLLVASCGGDSKLPTASGKGSIQAINAIKTAPEIAFRVEELRIADLDYQRASAIAEYDDLDYTFNFDVTYVGDDASTRIASQYIDFVAGQEYTLLLTGTVANPTLTLWEIAERDFAAGATVSQIRFAHTSEFLSATDLDFYLAPIGIVPAAGNELASVAFGDLSAPMDVESGDLVLTITSAGNPMDILYTSEEVTYAAASTFIASPFDATPGRTSNFTVHLIGPQAGAIELTDKDAQSTVQFLHAASDLGTVHIYDDAGLSSQLIADHMYSELSAPVPVASGDQMFRYTPTDTSSILLEGGLTVFPGIRYRFIVTGVNTNFLTRGLIPDTRSVETTARILVAQTSNNFDYMEFYLVDDGEPLDDMPRLRRVLTSSVPNIGIGMPAGDYDVYITDLDQANILAGPIDMNIVLGDVVDVLILDDPADPSILDLQILSGT